jgi:membrane protease YdiL (CAAX protease family)
MAQVRRIVIAVWLLGGAIAFLYAQNQHIPARIAIPVAAAYLIEISLFLLMAVWRPPNPWAIIASAIIPNLLYSIATGVFLPGAFLELTGLVGVVAFWLPVTRGRAWSDWVFMAGMGGVYLAKVLNWLYPEVAGLPKMDALGQLMWVRLAVTCMLENRPALQRGFGFLPNRAEVRLGILYFVAFMPLGALLVWWLKFAQFRVAPGYWWKGPGTFIGIFLVVALWEEFFFRGMMLEKLKKQWGTVLALSASSVVFGLVHLWFREFPNWQFAVIAGVAGVFYGLAYVASGGIRAAMVTHALVVATWRTFLA